MKGKLNITEQSIGDLIDFDDEGRICLWSIFASVTDEKNRQYSPDAWFDEEGHTLIAKLAKTKPLDELVECQKSYRQGLHGNVFISEVLYADMTIVLAYAKWLSPVLYQYLVGTYTRPYDLMELLN